MNTSISNIESSKAATDAVPVVNPEGASLVAPSPATPTLSLESVCEYACHVTVDKEANVITQMLMNQYMVQGLAIPSLCALIINIPERRKQIKLEEQWRALHPKGTLNTDNLPPALRTPAAISIWQALYAESMVDEDCQTLRSRTESGLTAAAIAKRLGIREVWKTFEELWGMRNLKSAKDKAYDFQGCWDFQKKLDTIII